ncbi:MAG: nucleotide sugar dehydrogenase [Burkholderiaceae bacterium]|nr:nucleotide sugar dehydrogenase [Burkholderiaceae bacterium]
MKISIFGLGYVGAVSLACLARDGHQVIGVDVDASKLAMLRGGTTPVVEEGMVDLVRDVVASGRVSVTDDVSTAIRDSEISLICVGTPSAPNGSQDQSAVLRLSADIGRALAHKTEPHVLVFRSTLAPGTVENVVKPIIERESDKPEGKGFHLCFQPEFLREGTSIRDYDRPPFTIVGAADPYPIEKLRQLFGHLPCEFIETTIGTAEMMKYCCNNFHALKITFANETARLCEALGVDPFEVMRLVCQDRQLNISPAYLKPGFAFGGSCLPKDLRATNYLARTHDVDLPMLGAILESNRRHLQHAIDKVLATGARRVAMVGLSFKTGTDDLRESPLVMLAEALIGKGVKLSIFDPDVSLSRLLGSNKRYIESLVPHIGELIADDLAQALSGAELVIVGTTSAPVLDVLAGSVQPEQKLLDLVNMPNGRFDGMQREGLCW